MRERERGADRGRGRELEGRRVRAEARERKATHKARCAHGEDERVMLLAVGGKQKHGHGANGTCCTSKGNSNGHTADDDSNNTTKAYRSPGSEVTPLVITRAVGGRLAIVLGGSRGHRDVEHVI